MILLSLGLIQEHMLPSRRRMDKIDHACLWAIKVCLVILFLTLPHAVVVSGEEQNNENQQQADSDFFSYCSGGKLEEVQAALEQHPSE
jgi:hypothetical protein